MQEISSVNQATCSACGACAAVCPNRIIKKDHAGQMGFRPDRLWMCFRCGQCMAACPTQSVQVAGLSYARDFFVLPERPQAGSFFDLIATRRSVRNFKEKPVPRELLEKIVQAIESAPPGFPPLKTELIAVQDPLRIRQALPHMIELYETLVKMLHHPVAKLVIRSEIGAEKYNTLTHHVAPLMKERLPELKAGTEDTITRGAPALILFHANRKQENYHGDIYIALTYGLLAAHALGLGASAIDLIPPVVERSKALRELFAIPAENEVVGAMILGYPVYAYRRGIRRSLKSVTWL